MPERSLADDRRVSVRHQQEPWTQWTVDVDGEALTVLGVPGRWAIPAHLRFPGGNRICFNVSLGTDVASLTLFSGDGVLGLALSDGCQAIEAPRFSFGYSDLVRWLTDPRVLLGECVATEVEVGPDIYLLSYFEGLVGSRKDGQTLAIGQAVTQAVRAVAELNPKNRHASAPSTDPRSGEHPGPVGG